MLLLPTAYCFLSSISSLIPFSGEVQEWLNWQHWKCCVRGTVPWVRIPPYPPDDCGLRTGGLRRAESRKHKAARQLEKLCLLPTALRPTVFLKPPVRNREVLMRNRFLGAIMVGAVV